MITHLFLSFAFAALPIKTQVELSVKEILTMPEKNREQIALTEKNKKKLYLELVDLAFEKKENMDVRWKALTLSSIVGGQDSIPHLLKAIKNEDWFMRNAGILALARLSPTLANKEAKKLLGDKALVVRSAAVKVISQKLNPETRDLLWEELDEKENFRKKQSLWIRSQILEVLAKNPEKRELPLFTKLVKDKDQRLKPLAENAVTKIKKIQ
jgi:HEAT repeat protein